MLSLKTCWDPLPVSYSGCCSVIFSDSRGGVWAALELHLLWLAPLREACLRLRPQGSPLASLRWVSCNLTAQFGCTSGPHHLLLWTAPLCSVTARWVPVGGSLVHGSRSSYRLTVSCVLVFLQGLWTGLWSRGRGHDRLLSEWHPLSEPSACWGTGSSLGSPGALWLPLREPGQVSLCPLRGGWMKGRSPLWGPLLGKLRMKSAEAQPLTRRLGKTGLCASSQPGPGGCVWAPVQPGLVAFCSLQFSSVTKLCRTLCDPVNHSTPGLPVHHQLPESTQTYVHWVGDAIQPSHPLLSPSPPALNLSQHQDLFKWVSSWHQVAKVLEFQLYHQSFQWTPRTDFL